jgi:RNA polymerase sigma factor (sigma-70 family)
LRRLARQRKEAPRGGEPDDPPDPDLSPLEALMEDERTGALASAMERLGDPCRAILLLYYYEEMSMEEIARRMGFANADTAKSKKYQCKKALERLVKGVDHG